MGSLMKTTPYSEITALLEVLDRHGVGRDDLKKFRTAAPEVQSQVAHMFKFADSVTTISTKLFERKKLLELVTTMPAFACNRFVASEHFKVDTGKSAKVKIAWLGNNFKELFLSKTEEDVLAGELKIYKLLQSSLDAPIMTELGDPRAYSTALADIWWMLKTQPNGEDGALLVNGYANIFYINDAKGNLWSVLANWSPGKGGWYFEAGSIGQPGGWVGVCQVVSR